MAVLVVVGAAVYLLLPGRTSARPPVHAAGPRAPDAWSTDCDVAALAVGVDAQRAGERLALVSPRGQYVVSFKELPPGAPFTEAGLHARLGADASGALRHVTRVLAGGRCASVGSLLPWGPGCAGAPAEVRSVCHALLQRTNVGVIKASLAPWSLGEAVNAHSNDSSDVEFWRCLIFQLVFTLAALQQIIPGVRHNDLGVNMRAAPMVPTADLVVYTLPQGGQHFRVPGAMPISLQVTDFELAWAPSLPNPLVDEIRPIVC